MSGVGTNLDVTSGNTAAASLPRRQQMLRASVQEMVGQTFFGQMLKIARNSPLNNKMFHGGRGEQVFGAQLDAEFAKQVGTGTKNSLADAIYDRLAKGL
jgi:hypothetical protein